MKTGRSNLNLKTLQNSSTNRTALKGLLTYRTFQFSMSSIPPSGTKNWHQAKSGKNSQNDSKLPINCWLFDPFLRVLFPFQGQKIGGADFISLIRPLRPLLVTQLNLSQLQRLSKSFFSFFSRCSLLAEALVWPLPSGLTKNVRRRIAQARICARVFCNFFAFFLMAT